MKPGEKVAVWVAYGAMCLIWGTTWLAIKVGLHTLGPLTGVGLRFLIAGIFLYAIAALRGELLPFRALPWRLVLVLAGLLFGVNYILTYTAEIELDSGMVAVLFGTLPFFAFGFSRAMLGERITGRIVIGSLIAFGGVALISLTKAVEASPLYALAAVGAAVSSAFANVYAKRHQHHRPLVGLPPAMVIAGTAVTALGLIFERTDWSAAVAPAPLLALLYLSIFGSGIAFFAMMWVLQRLPVSTVALSSLIYPVIAIAAGALLGGETVAARELLGSGLVIAGLWLALSTSSPPPQQVVSPSTDELASA